jgi:tetratricopeptide (TPR) repeat protein
MRSTCKPLLIVAFVGTVIAIPALAQQSSTDYPIPCDASKVSKGDVERAHTVFLSGKQFLEESNYDKAISYFKDAYTIDCSVHAILPIIAATYERKGDKVNAVRALEEYLKRAPGAPDHDLVERRIRNLSDQLAREQPSATAAPSASPAVTAATAAATPSAEPVPTTTASAAPVRVAEGETPAESASGHSAAPWIVVGIGGAAIVTGAVMLGIGSGDISGALDRCPTRQSCPKDVASQGNNGRTLEAAGVVAGLVGIGAVGVGLVWHFTEKGAEAKGAQVSPVVGPHYAGFALSRAF